MQREHRSTKKLGPDSREQLVRGDIVINREVPTRSVKSNQNKTWLHRGNYKTTEAHEKNAQDDRCVSRGEDQPSFDEAAILKDTYLRVTWECLLQVFF